MKKFFGILFTCLVFASCKNFLSDNQSILDKLREEVKVNTAPEIAGVTFSQPKSIDGSSQIGTISLVGNASVLVDVKFRIELEINPKDGYFNEWQAFLRDKDGLKPVEGTDLIEFTQINTNPADVVIKKQVDNLVIGAKINYTPSVSIASPDYGTSSISGVAKMLDGETLPVVFNSEQYGLSVFKISYRDMANSAIQSFDLKEMPEYTEKLELKKEDGTLLYTLHNFRINKSLSNLSFVIEPADTLDDIYSLSVDTEKRSEIRETDPINGKEGLMRTTPIKIRFSSDMDCSQITEENFRDYVTVERVVIDETTSEETLYDCFADEGNKLDENRTRCYFNIPEFASDKKTLLITPQNKTKESEWLPSGSTIRVTVKDNLRNQEGIPLLQDHTFSFSLGTKGDAEGPIITKDKTKLSIYSSKKNIEQSEWGDFEPSKNAVAGHTYADSIHVGPGEKFKVNIQATDVNTGDTGIKDFVADIRLMYVYEGGRLPNSSEKASKNLILFDKDGNWLYEAGCLKQDFNREYTVPYTGTNKMAETGSNFLIDFEDFKTEDSLSVDGIYRIELTARDMLENYASNSNVYYVVRDTTPPDAEKNANQVSFEECGIMVENKRYFGGPYNSIKISINSIFDSGSLGQPSTGCSSSECEWRAVLSTSKLLCDETTILGIVSDYFQSTSFINLQIPDDFIKNSSTDSNVYIWIKIKDNFGAETPFIYVPNLQPIVSSNKIPSPLLDISTSRFDSDRQNLYIVTDNFDVGFKSSDESTLSRFGWYLKYQFSDDNGENWSDVTSIPNMKLNVENGKKYKVFAENGIGVRSDSVLIFNVIKDNSSPLIQNASMSGAIKNGTFFNTVSTHSGHISNSYVSYSPKNDEISLENFTNEFVVFDFIISENGLGMKQNGISFEGMSIYGYLNDFDDDSENCVLLGANQKSIPIPEGTLFENTKFRVFGILDNVAPNLVEKRQIKLILKDAGNNFDEIIKEITLDTLPPEIDVEFTEGLLEKTGETNDENGKTIYFEVNYLIPGNASTRTKEDGFNFTIKANDTSSYNHYFTRKQKWVFKEDSINDIEQSGNVVFTQSSYPDPKNSLNYVLAYYKGGYGLRNLNSVQNDNVYTFIPSVNDNACYVYVVGKMFTDNTLKIHSDISQKYTLYGYDAVGNKSTLNVVVSSVETGPSINYIDPITNSEKTIRNGDVILYKDEKGIDFNIKSITPLKEDYVCILGSTAFSSRDTTISLKDISSDNSGTEITFTNLVNMSGASSNFSFTLKKDIKGPDINISSCEGMNSDFSQSTGQYTNGHQRITFTVSDDNDISDSSKISFPNHKIISYQISGYSKRDLSDENKKTLDMIRTNEDLNTNSITVELEGPEMVTIIAEDKLGNKSGKNYSGLILDNKPPYIGSFDGAQYRRVSYGYDRDTPTQSDTPGNTSWSELKYKTISDLINIYIYYGNDDDFLLYPYQVNELYDYNGSGIRDVYISDSDGNKLSGSYSSFYTSKNKNVYTKTDGLKSKTMKCYKVSFPTVDLNYTGKRYLCAEDQVGNKGMIELITTKLSEDYAFSSSSGNPASLISGTYKWEINTELGHSALGCLKSASGNHSQTSEAKLTTAYKTNYISFWYKVSSEIYYDYFEFKYKKSSDPNYITLITRKSSRDLESQSGIASGYENSQWKFFETKLEGEPEILDLSWCYIKDGTQSNGDDCVLIDDISLSIIR